MEKNEPGSVSRSVALPPSVWELVDRAFPEVFASRSAYILELVKSDLREKDGVISSAISEKRKSSVRGETRTERQISADEVELFAQKIANEIEIKMKSGAIARPPAKSVIKESISTILGHKPNKIESPPPALSTHMPQGEAEDILKGDKPVPQKPASKKPRRNSA